MGPSIPSCSRTFRFVGRRLSGQVAGFKLAIVIELPETKKSTEGLQNLDFSSLNGTEGLFGGLHLGGLAPVGHLLDDPDDILKLGEGHGLQLGEDELPVDGDLEGRPPADHPLQLGARNLAPDHFGQVPIARLVTSSAAVLHRHGHGHGGRRGHIPAVARVFLPS